MLDILLILGSQLSFGFLRTLNVRYAANEKMTATLITSFGIKVTWLIGTYYGVKSMLDIDILNLSVYLIAGVVGDRLSFFIKVVE